MEEMIKSLRKELLDAINYIRALEEYHDVISEMGTLQEKMGRYLFDLKKLREKVNIE
jgi:hypothetical protein